MKTALLLSGHMRYFKECFSSLKRSILSVLNPDIYIHTWDEQDRSMWNDSVSNLNERFIEEYNIPVKKIVVEKWSEAEPRLNEKLVKIGNRVDYFKPIRMVSMYYKIQECFKLIENETYDLVIRARPDLFYENIIENNFQDLGYFIKIPKSYSNPRIAVKDLNLNFPIDEYLKQGQEKVDSYFVGEPNDCGGYLDQFAIGDYNSMKTYCNAYDAFDNYSSQGYNFSGPEVTLKYHLDSNNLNIVRDDLKFYIMRNWRFL
jgi:hypothetical protein